MTKLAFLCLLALSLGACVPAAITAGLVGFTDVAFFHGCTATHVANALPWNASDQYQCVKK